MKNVCFFGTHLWSTRLAELVNMYGNGTIRAVPVSITCLSFLRQLLSLLKADVLVRVGFRPGVKSLRGIVFDFLWLLTLRLNPTARQIYYWIGTDVLRVLDNKTASTGFLSKYFFERARKRATHFAAAPWLAEELGVAGFHAKSVLFPSPLTCHLVPPDLPLVFSVLSYIPDDRYAFYGGEMFLQAARSLPAITFHVVAGEGAWAENPPDNLHFHGWVSDMTSMYLSSSVVVRLVPHDALGGTVREGLAFARHVVYSYPLPHTKHVSCGDVVGLETALINLFKKHLSGELLPNNAGMDFAKENYDERILTQNLIKELV